MACETSKKDKLIVVIKAKVEPTPELIELLKRYRDGLNLAIRWAVEWARANGRMPTLSEVHKALYEPLKALGLPSVIAQDCFREASAVVKSYFANGARSRTPVVRKLHMWLRRDAYSVNMYLHIAVEVPRSTPIAPKGVIVVDINEQYVYYGNSQWVKKVETPVEKAVRLRELAEGLERKYSAPCYTPWNRRSGVRERIRRLYKKARDMVEDWAKKTAKRIVEEARERQYAVAVEDLTGLVESIGELPKEHRVKLVALAYRRLLWWIKWQATKRGVVVVEVDPRGTSTTCPKCGGKMEEVGHRRMRCATCGFEAGRDVVAVLNIEKKASERLGIPTFSPLLLTPS